MDRRCVAGLLAGLFAISSYAQAQVVADDACPKHAVDMAAYATCDGDKVATAHSFGLRHVMLAEGRVARDKQTSLGLYVDAVGAHLLKINAKDVFLVDVRSQLELVLAGQAPAVDIHVPYAEHTLYRNESGRGWTIAENDQFIEDLAQRLQQRGADIDALILVMCRSGERSARVVDRLAELGFLLAVNVIDGFEGDLGNDGRRSVNGWKNAGLEWTQDPQAIAGFVGLSTSN